MNGNQSFSTIIDSIKSPLILLPTNPYFDQVAAGLSLYLALTQKKNTSISCATPMLVEFNRLVGVNRVSQEVGNKNMVIRFADYPANDIEKVSYDIENQQFRLTVIPKPDVAPPTKEQVNIAYSGLSTDSVILIGGGNKNHFPLLSSKEVAVSQLIHIGVRDLEGFDGQKIISFARPSSSISELTVGLMKEAGFDLDADISTNLLMGIEEGSKNFTGQDVTAETFSMVSDLMRAGGKRVPKDLPKPRQQMPTSPLQPMAQPATKAPPKSWLEPKIYKGTSVS